jgi:predicted O-methyltransferase YrrM
MTEDGREKPQSGEIRARRQPEFILDLRRQPAFDRLNPVEQWFATNAADYLMESSLRQLINLTEAQHIIQFGASKGNETIALAELTRQNGGTVTALEIHNKRGEVLKRSHIIPAKRIYIGDGITYLEQMAERGETCDLITAFFLDWVEPEQLTRRLIPAAQAVLPSGSLLVTSDIDTMMDTRGVFEELGIQYDLLNAGTDLQTTAEGMWTRNKAGGAYEPPFKTIYSSHTLPVPSAFPALPGFQSLPGTQRKDTVPYFRHSGIVTSFQKNHSSQ